MSEQAEPLIRATQFSALDWCWMYALTNGIVVKGKMGDARVPCGLPFNERTQWGANQVFARWTAP